MTKDRPARLDSTGGRIREMRGSSQVIVVDDSTSAENMSRIRRICDMNGFNYHGAEQQQSTLDSSIGQSARDFIGRLSTPGWSIGLTRNYILLLAELEGCRKFVMIDDDIQLARAAPPRGNDRSPIQVARNYLARWRFVGATTEGMADDSVLGHLYRKVLGKIQTPRYPSGSFLGARTKGLSHFFLNFYNEDWIWLYLETKGREPPTPISVRQLGFDPFFRASAKASLQEFGEVLWEGVSHSRGKSTLLLEAEFWKESINRRLKELEPLRKARLDGELKRVRDAAMRHLQEAPISATSCVEEFRRYFERLPDWHGLLGDCRALSEARKPPRSFF